MEVHLVLKENPESRPDPVFLKSNNENKIVFPKFQTQFDFKSVNYFENDVFSTVALPLIDDKFFKGEDSLLLTLGPTNSGKSHILFKSNNSIVDQSLKHIFNNIDPLSSNVSQIRKYYPNIIDSRSPDTSCDSSMTSSLHLSVSIFELYNDNIIDLLNQNNKSISRENSIIVTDPIDSKLIPRNISKCLVNSYESIHDVVFNALQKRKTFPTFTNSDSSRSHCFIFLNLHKIYADVIQTTRFSIVDLAGLERTKSAKTSGLSLREASYTNASLTELGRCLELISMKQFHKTCLRTNKLTRLVLNDYVKCNHPVCILVTLDPFGEEGLILQTLRYIDPIKYQHLQRKSLLNIRKKSKTIDEREQKGLINEIDRLRQNQKILKSKVNNLEESVVENENNIRSELYKQHERNIYQLTIDHKEEINKMSQNFIYQTDQKLQDQSDSFKLKLDEAQKLINEKQTELDLTNKQLLEKKTELETLYSEYSQLKTILEENSNTVDDLNLKIEEFNNANENLKIEIDTLTLKIVDLEASHKEELDNLNLIKAKIIDDLQKDLDTSNETMNSLKNDLKLLNEQLGSKNEQNENLLKEQSDLQNNLSMLTLNLENKDNEILKINSENFDKMKKLSELLSSKELLIESLNVEIHNLKTEIFSKSELYEKLQSEKSFEILNLQNEIDNLKSSISSIEIDKQNVVDKLTDSNNTFKSTIEFLEQMLQAKDQDITQLENDKHLELENYKSSIDQKNAEIKNISREIQSLNAMLNSERSNFQNEIENKTIEFTKILEENKNKMRQANCDFEEAKKDFQKKLDKNNTLLEEETQKNNNLKVELEMASENVNKNFTKALEKANSLAESIKDIQQKLDHKNKELESMVSSKKNTEEELAKLQLLCSDLKSELSDKEKVYEKYVALKSKNSEYSTYVKKLQTEKEKAIQDLKDKDVEVENLEKQVEKLKNRLALTEEKNLAESKRQSSAEIDNAISSFSEGKINKTSRDSLNILDTDPLDDIGLPSIMSSPIKANSFLIHSDSLDKENTISFGSQSQKKKNKNKNKKFNKQELLLQQRQLHEKKMALSERTKTDKNKYKALANSKPTDLNKRLSLPSTSKIADKIGKKRKTLSPMKPLKKKIRKSIGGDDSLDLLE
ncbi:hypothetical protein C6P40_005222 [Pichia californica]|uniref:Kinesin motor domain-containing protein n=1 Tax=Pichia californica TaxID=460514 RepID=A0A9P7BEH5_9ASCO|nr:hypothetical protein C6P40_005222 [[Candida] californica]